METEILLFSSWNSTILRNLHKVFCRISRLFPDYIIGGNQHRVTKIYLEFDEFVGSTFTFYTLLFVGNQRSRTDRSHHQKYNLAKVIDVDVMP